MAFTPAWTKTVRPFLGAFGLCSWFGNFTFLLTLARRSPDAADPAAGLTSRLTNHGHDFFVQPWQGYVFSLALVGSMLLFATNLSELNSAIREGRWRLILPAILASALVWAALVFNASAGSR